LTSKFNQFIFVPICTEVVSLLSFAPAVYKVVNKLLVCGHRRTHGRTDSPKTECLRHRSNDDRGVTRKVAINVALLPEPPAAMAVSYVVSFMSILSFVYKSTSNFL